MSEREWAEVQQILIIQVLHLVELLINIRFALWKNSPEYFHIVYEIQFIGYKVLLRLIFHFGIQKTLHRMGVEGGLATRNLKIGADTASYLSNALSTFFPYRTWILLREAICPVKTRAKDGQVKLFWPWWYKLKLLGRAPGKGSGIWFLLFALLLQT